jgi:hypothetical protein
VNREVVVRIVRDVDGAIAAEHIDRAVTGIDDGASQIDIPAVDRRARNDDLLRDRVIIDGERGGGFIRQFHQAGRTSIQQTLDLRRNPRIDRQAVD